MNVLADKNPHYSQMEYSNLPSKTLTAMPMQQIKSKHQLLAIKFLMFFFIIFIHIINHINTASIIINYSRYNICHIDRYCQFHLEVLVMLLFTL